MYNKTFMIIWHFKQILARLNLIKPLDYVGLPMKVQQWRENYNGKHKL